MKEFEIDGIKYGLVKPLKKSELDAIHHVKRNQGNLLEEAIIKPERGTDLFNRQGVYNTEMKAAAVAKCLGLKEEQVGNMQVRVLFFLYDELVKYSESRNYR